MSKTKIFLVGLFCFSLFIPIIYAQSGAWIEKFSITSDVVPGENVTTSVIVGYSFTNQVELNPGIFSFAADDWIVDDYRTVTGSGNETFTLEFPVPEAEGVHLYQANVWYIKSGSWYFDGSVAAWNFTIGDENVTTSLDFLNIVDVNTPLEVNISSQIEVEVFIEYSIVSEGDYSIRIRDETGETLGEEYDVLSGESASNYTLLMNTPDVDGTYTYAVVVEAALGENSTIIASSSFNIYLMKPIEPEPDINTTTPEPPVNNNTTTDPPDNNTTTPDPDEPEPEEPVKDNRLRNSAIVLGIGAILGVIYWRSKN